jgi:hypothetical protein
MRRRLRVITPLLLIAGLALMIPFEGPAFRVPGMACLFGFIVCGVFLVASPEFLAADDRVGSTGTEEES